MLHQEHKMLLKKQEPCPTAEVEALTLLEVAHGQSPQNEEERQQALRATAESAQLEQSDRLLLSDFLVKNLPSKPQSRHRFMQDIGEMVHFETTPVLLEEVVALVAKAACELMPAKWSAFVRAHLAYSQASPQPHIPHSLTARCWHT